MSSYILHPGPLRAGIFASLLAFLGKLPDSTAWEIKITKWAKERSDYQNHALFGVAYKVMAAETGFTKDELHEALCKRFFGTVEYEVMGQRMTRPFRTTTTNEHGERDVMNAIWFADFYTQVQNVAAEAGIFVPDPDREKRKR